MQKTETLFLRFWSPHSAVDLSSVSISERSYIPHTFIWTWNAKRCISLDPSCHDTSFSLLLHKMICYWTRGLCIMCLQGRVGINIEIQSLFYSFIFFFFSSPYINYPDVFWQQNSNDSGMVISFGVLQARGVAKKQSRCEGCQIHLPFIIPANRG